MEPTETTPLPLTASSRPSQTASTEVSRVIVYGLVMILCSVGLINFNRHLVKTAFPFPTHLVLMHTAFGSVLTSILYFVKPSFFPSLTDVDSKVSLNRELIIGKALPIAFVFAGNLVLSNMAYMYSSLAFLQMMKEGNVVLVYLGSLVAGIEVFKSRSCGVLTLIMFATMLNVKGEIHFSLVGTLIQGASQIFEVIRLVLQAIVLSDSGQKLDSLAYVLVVMPLCFVLVALLLALRSFGVMGSADASPIQWSDVYGCWHLLLLNALLAFCLNVSIAVFVKHTSAVAMVLAGLVKDSMIVVTSVIFLGEAVSHAQQVGFALQLGGVLVWSLMKRFPHQFEEHGVMGGMRVVLFGHKWELGQFWSGGRVV